MNLTLEGTIVALYGQSDRPAPDAEIICSFASEDGDATYTHFDLHTRQGTRRISFPLALDPDLVQGAFVRYQESHKARVHPTCTITLLNGPHTGYTYRYTADIKHQLKRTTS